MSIDPITAALNVGNSIIERIWPDPADQAQAKLDLDSLHQKGDLAAMQALVQLMVAQLKVNEAEAKSGNLFQAGWRPSVGWVCSLALFYNYIVYDLLVWVVEIADIPGAIPPRADMTQLMPLLLGMLGIGGMRSFDKVKRVDTKRVG